MTPQHFKKIQRASRGAVLSEYVTLVGLLAVVVITPMLLFGTTNRENFETVASSLSLIGDPSALDDVPEGWEVVNIPDDPNFPPSLIPVGATPGEPFACPPASVSLSESCAVVDTEITTDDYPGVLFYTGSFFGGGNIDILNPAVIGWFCNGSRPSTRVSISIDRPADVHFSCISNNMLTGGAGGYDGMFPDFHVFEEGHFNITTPAEHSSEMDMDICVNCAGWMGEYRGQTYSSSHDWDPMNVSFSDGTHNLGDDFGNTNCSGVWCEQTLAARVP